MMKLALLLEWERVLSLVVYCRFFIIVLVIGVKKSYSVNFKISWRSSNETTKKEENLYAVDNKLKSVFLLSIRLFKINLIFKCKSRLYNSSYTKYKFPVKSSRLSDAIDILCFFTGSRLNKI